MSKKQEKILVARRIFCPRCGNQNKLSLNYWAIFV